MTTELSLSDGSAGANSLVSGGDSPSADSATGAGRSLVGASFVRLDSAAAEVTLIVEDVRVECASVIQIDVVARDDRMKVVYKAKHPASYATHTD